jgi:hypothetical protein
VQVGNSVDAAGANTEVEVQNVDVEKDLKQQNSTRGLGALWRRIPIRRGRRKDKNDKNKTHEKRSSGSGAKQVKRKKSGSASGSVSVAPWKKVWTERLKWLAAQSLLLAVNFAQNEMVRVIMRWILFSCLFVLCI